MRAMRMHYVITIAARVVRRAGRAKAGRRPEGGVGATRSRADGHAAQRGDDMDAAVAVTERDRRAFAEGALEAVERLLSAERRRSADLQAQVHALVHSGVRMDLAYGPEHDDIVSLRIYGQGGERLVRAFAELLSLRDAAIGGATREELRAWARGLIHIEDTAS